MARANRHHLKDQIWHITHRCHKREFLLKFSKDKYRWLKWLFEAKKRYGLCILNYTVTSNHIHLLVLDEKEDVIPKSIQLIAGRTGREYNQRKKRRGAFWEDRYHATAVDTSIYLIQCLTYIDLNMVRTGVIQHPSEWKFGGYNEIQDPKPRYRLINRQKIIDLLGQSINMHELSIAHKSWVEERLMLGSLTRDSAWTESIAVGSKKFVENVKLKLGAKAIGRNLTERTDGFEIREEISPYNAVFEPEKEVLSPKNTYFWNVYPGNTI